MTLVKSLLFLTFFSLMFPGDESDEHTEHLAGGGASCTSGLASRGGLPAPGNPGESVLCLISELIQVVIFSKKNDFSLISQVPPCP
jgi:hypothetical protein